MALHQHPDLSLAQQLAAAQDWWRVAGVDCAFVDEPQAMLRAEVAEVAAPARKAMPVVEETAPPVAPALNAADLPQTLAAFADWWCDPASPLPQVSGLRVPPRGEAAARLMIVVPMPEAGDVELLSDIQGRMIGNMLKALGIAPDAAYFASALPAPMAVPDWEGLAAGGLGTVLAHHIALARPDRVLLLGSPLAKLLVEEPAMPMLAAFAPDQLLAHPRQRARLWGRLLDWMPPV